MIRAASGPDAPEIVSGPLEISGHPTMVVRSRRPGSIQAIHASGLVQFARQHRCTLVLNHVVGDFFPAGAAVIQVYGGEAAGRRAEQRLHGMFVLGVERTIEQDPAFAVRIMVDVAIKALSPAVNDPTTAVQVINHLGDLLHVVGSTDFRPRQDGGAETGRVLIRARGWEEYLALGVTEIRAYGASSVQVVRRLRAMLEELHGAVRPEYRSAVEDELARLEVEVARAFGRHPISTARASPTDRDSEAHPVSATGRPSSSARKAWSRSSLSRQARPPA